MIFSLVGKLDLPHRFFCINLGLHIVLNSVKQ